MNWIIECFNTPYMQMTALKQFTILAVVLAPVVIAYVLWFIWTGE